MTPSKPSTEPSPAPPVTASVRIAASPDVVFPYFTDPALATRWIASAALLEARPGGIFSLDVRGNPARGEYLEVDPPHRVRFSWGIEGSEDLPPGTSTVEVVFEADGGDTVVTLTHRDLPTAAYRRSHEAGWGEFLGILAGSAGSGGSGGSRGSAG